MSAGRRIMLLLLALAAIMLSLSGRAGAVGTGAKAVLTIRFHPGGEPVRGAAFRLYRVAELTPAGTYVLREGYPALPEGESAEAWRQYAATLEKHVTAEGILPEASVFTDAKGDARAEELTPGLYLVTGKGYYGDGVYVSPAAFLVSLPRLDEAGVWQYDVTVVAKYESDPTGERLPQTGLVRWPVPVLLGSGLILLAAGFFLRRKGAGE